MAPVINVNASLRCFLLLVPLLILAYVVRRIRKSAFDISDSIFWLIISVLLIVLAVIPGIALWTSDFLGFESPANFIFLCGIVILFIRTIMQDQKICALRKKLTTLAQSVALRNEELDERDSKQQPICAAGREKD